MTNTKIIATVGPACGDASMIGLLIDAGVTVFRLNSSHGSTEVRDGWIDTIRGESERRGLHIGILLDLQGPKIRLGKFQNGQATLIHGADFTITVEDVLGNETIASTTYADFARDLKPGDRVLLADGSLELRVLEADGIRARCTVVTGGLIKDNKGINLPGAQLSTPSLTRKDMADLQAGLAKGIDMVAMSFVRRPSDVLRLRLFL